jgi:ergot alkaloid biosynthesis protein
MDPSKVLVIGGTGKTGSRIAARLQQRGFPVALGSRTPRGAGTVHFDWTAPETFEPACAGVRAVYLIAPLGELNPAPVMQSFIEKALRLKVARFVLLSSSMLQEDGPAMGAVHGFLRRNAPEWAVLQPSWFMQNFAEGAHQASIRNEGRISSATGSGAVAFIHADDIAEVGVRALIDQPAHNRAHLITGPTTVTYDDVAAEITRVCGYTVRHEKISTQELATRWSALGLPADYANMLANMDEAISHGAENRTTTTVKDVTGREPTGFTEFVRANAQAWISSDKQAVR